MKSSGVYPVGSVTYVSLTLGKPPKLSESQLPKLYSDRYLSFSRPKI